ncbi:MAG: hypothetical protein AAFR31_09850 [Cyanobacteria bacterium J06627_8]
MRLSPAAGQSSSIAARILVKNVVWLSPVPLGQGGKPFGYWLGTRIILGVLA